MNNAAIASSERLQRVMQVLADGQPHSTRDIIRAANVCAVNSVIAELREQGISIHCHRRGLAWYYQLGATT